MRSLVALAPALLLAFAGSSEAACQFDLGKIYFGFESPMRGQADSGKPCGFALSSASTAGSSAYHVSQPPHHGVAGIGDNGGMPVIAYRSAAGYHGPDEFVVSFMGGDIRRPDMESSIHVYLDVQ